MLFPSWPSPSCATRPSCPCTRSSKSECFHFIVFIQTYKLQLLSYLPLTKKQQKTTVFWCLNETFPPKQPLSQKDARRRQRVFPGHVHHVPAGCTLRISDLQRWVSQTGETYIEFTLNERIYPISSKWILTELLVAEAEILMLLLCTFLKRFGTFLMPFKCQDKIPSEQQRVNLASVGL